MSIVARAWMCIFPAAQLLPAESAMFMKPAVLRGTTTDCDGPVVGNTERTLLKLHGAANHKGQGQGQVRAGLVFGGF